jgi:hypothetical protein
MAIEKDRSSHRTYECRDVFNFALRRIGHSVCTVTASPTVIAYNGEPGCKQLG